MENNTKLTIKELDLDKDKNIKIKVITIFTEDGKAFEELMEELFKQIIAQKIDNHL